MAIQILVLIASTISCFPIYSSLLKESYQHLEPIHGATLLANHWVKHIHKHGNPKKDALVKLVHNLYHLHGSQLIPSKIPSHLGNYVTPQFTAKLLLTLDKQESDILNVLKHTDLYTSRQRSLAKLLKKALHLCATDNKSAFYLPYTVHKLILGALYLKDQQCGEGQGALLHEYFKHLYEYKPEAFARTDFSLQSIQNLYYSDISQKELQNNLDAAYKLITQDTFSAIKKLMSLRQHISPFPPQITEKDIECGSCPKRPNCVETALLDTTSFILYNPEKQTYDPNSTTLHPRVLEFFKKAHPSTINNYETHQAWCNLLWGKPETFTYRQKEKNYEVASFYEPNILAGINHLFGLKETTWADIGKKLSSNMCTISCKDTAKDTATLVTIEKLYKNIAQQALITITKKHTHCDVTDRDEHTTELYSKDILKKLVQDLEKKPNDSGLASLTSFVSVNDCLKSLDKTTSLPVINHLIFTLNMDNIQRAKEILEKIIPIIAQQTCIVPITKYLLNQIDLEDQPTYNDIKQSLDTHQAQQYGICLDDYINT